jgi:signal transduction histidine kinase
MLSKPIPNNTLHGAGLFTARAIWIVIAVLTLGVFLALVPYNLNNIANDADIARAASALTPLISRQTFAVYLLVLRYLAAAVFLITAGVIFWHKSRDGLALFVSLTLILMPLGFNLGGYTDLWWRNGSSLDSLLAAADRFLRVLGPLCFLLLFYLFPDGQFTPRWLRWAALMACAALLAFGALQAVVNSDQAWPLFVVALLVAIVVALGGQVYRYRRTSTLDQRQQTKWVLLGLCAMPIYLAVFLPLDRLLGTSSDRAGYALLSLHAELIAIVLIPLAIGFSILRYRLWNIDVILKRTIVYGALTVIIAGLYVFVVGIVGALFDASHNLILSIIATGLAAALFQPLRQRLQRGVNRLLYGERDDPATVLSRLGQRLEVTLAPEAVLPAIVETVAQALKSPYAAIALKRADDFEIMAAQGQPDRAGNPIELPLRYQTEMIGQLIVALRAPGESYSAADRRLLDNLAHQAGIAVHNVRLTADLQRSRERLVTAREEERRRLRRDLHDGLGPTLASQTFRIDAALDLLDADPAAARSALIDLKTQMQATVADIRRLVYELRPPALDELGLVSALREHVMRFGGSANGLHIAVEAPTPGLPPLSAAVEVAAYRIALEAVTNVVRHAHAQHCTVRFSTDTALCIDIHDDGIGLPPDLRAGIGITSMRERAEELGGTCVIESQANQGTQVSARLPNSVASSFLRNEPAQPVASKD